MNHNISYISLLKMRVTISDIWYNCTNAGTERCKNFSELKKGAYHCMRNSNF